MLEYAKQATTYPQICSLAPTASCSVVNCTPPNSNPTLIGWVFSDRRARVGGGFSAVWCFAIAPVVHFLVHLPQNLSFLHLTFGQSPLTPSISCGFRADAWVSTSLTRNLAKPFIKRWLMLCCIDRMPGLCQADQSTKMKRCVVAVHRLGDSESPPRRYHRSSQWQQNCWTNSPCSSSVILG